MTDPDPLDWLIMAAASCADYDEVLDLIAEHELDDEASALALAAWLGGMPHARPVGRACLLPILTDDGELWVGEWSAETGQLETIHHGLGDGEQAWVTAPPIDVRWVEWAQALELTREQEARWYEVAEWVADAVDAGQRSEDERAAEEM